MRPIFWLLIAGLLAILLWLWLPRPQPLPQANEAATPLAAWQQGHWLVGAGALSASVQLSTTGPAGALTTQNLVLLSLYTKSFQGLIAVALAGERWLRRGEELYRLLPGESEVTRVEDETVKQTPFLGSALSVEEFLFGFRSYAQLESELDEQGRLKRLKAYDSQNTLTKILEILSYAQFQGQSLLERLRVEDVQDGRQTEVWVKERKVLALPEFAFTADTLKNLQIQPPK